MSSGEVQYAAPFHRDLGLFLVVTPFPGSALVVRDRRGEVVSTEEVRQDGRYSRLLPTLQEGGGIYNKIY